MDTEDKLTAAQKAFIADDQLQASIVWGFTLGFELLTAVKAVGQTRKILRRTGPGGNTYIWLVWGLLVANFCGGILVWMGIYGKIKPSVAYYFFLRMSLVVPQTYLFQAINNRCVVVTWIPQVQFIPQIIINRISLLLYSPKEARSLKIGTAVILTMVNISVFCIWIPAQLRISERYIHINHIWDRIEKGIFLVVDACLNGLFIYLVRSRLIALGLKKYKPLFYFNLFIIAISLSLDVLLIGMMSLPNAFVYAQFHPLVYTVKLNIEMSMANLIIKIVRSSERRHSDYWQDYQTSCQGKDPGQHTTAQGSTRNRNDDNDDDDDIGYHEIWEAEMIKANAIAPPAERQCSTVPTTVSKEASGSEKDHGTATVTERECSSDSIASASEEPATDFVTPRVGKPRIFSRF